MTKIRFGFSLDIVVNLLNNSFSMISETFKVAQIKFTSLGNINSGMIVSYAGQVIFVIYFLHELILDFHSRE